MISKFSISKALRDHAKIVANNQNLPLVSIGASEDYQSNPEEAYVEEIPLFGKDRPIGLADDSSDMQVGIYQININYPLSWSKWKALNYVDVFSLWFKRGTELIHNGQMLRIRELESIPLKIKKTHGTYILSITFTVIN